MASRRLWWRRVLSVLLAPAMMTIFIPALTGATADVDAPDFGTTRGWLLAVCGGLLIAFGLGMLVWTVVLFDRIGEGTLAIGSPVNLVGRGPYPHVRKPIMKGVFCIQLRTAVPPPSPWPFGRSPLVFPVDPVATPAGQGPVLRRR